MQLQQVVRDFPFSALVGFTNSVVMVSAAAQALGATPAQAPSWIWALGMGRSTIGMSW